MHKYRFTVFTPCYNGGATIGRVAESLERQTFRDFEWIIVDDCSTDGTKEVLSTLAKKAEYPVRIFEQEKNRGKPSAINIGVSLAEGDFFLIIDADDAFTDDALESFASAWEALPEDSRKEISGVIANCRDQNGAFIGTPYPVRENETLICDVFDMRYLYKVDGEKWGFTRTDIMKEFPFNTSEDSFVTENTVWFAIADRYKTAFINKTLRVYYRHENAQSLSAVGQKKHPAGFAFYYREILNKYAKKMRLGPADLVRMHKNHLKYTMYAHKSILGAILLLEGFGRKALAFACIPIAWLAVLLDAVKRKQQ